MRMRKAHVEPDLAHFHLTGLALADFDGYVASFGQTADECADSFAGKAVTLGEMAVGGPAIAVGRAQRGNVPVEKLGVWLELRIAENGRGDSRVKAGCARGF